MLDPRVREDDIVGSCHLGLSRGRLLSDRMVRNIAPYIAVIGCWRVGLCSLVVGEPRG